MTKQRELILSILKQADRHLTADEVFFLAKLKMPSIAMATIYNNLNAMHEADMVLRTHIDGSADCFELASEPHDHLLCDGCGRISDVRIPSLSQTLETALGEAIEHYDLTIHYLCPECRRKKR